MRSCDTHVTESGTLAFRVALSVLRHREDAEDVAQEAVVRSLQRFDSLRDRTQFRAWLVRVTWRLALDRRRSETRRAARDVRLVENALAHVSAEHHLIVRERADRLWTAIDSLPPRLRLPLVLGTLQGHSQDEIASLLGLPVGTVKSRIFEARRRLKRALIGTGVFVSATALVLSMIAIQRVHLPDTRPVGVSPTRVMPDVVTPDSVPAPAPAARLHRSRPTPVNLSEAETAVAFTSEAPKASTIQVPIVEVKAVTLKAVEVPVVPVPLIQLPTVEVANVKVPMMKRVFVGTSETHQER